MEKEISVKDKVTKNTIYTAVGRFWQSLVGLFLTPYVVSRLGTERFGIWALVWVIVGYTGFIEFGVTNALIKYLSEFHARKEWDRINQLVNTGLAFYTLIAAATVAAGLLCYKVITHLLNIPPYLYEEASFAIKMGIVIFGVRYLLYVPGAIQTALQRRDISCTLNVVTTTINAVATVVLLKSGAGIKGLIFLSGTMLLVSCLAEFVIVFVILPNLRFSLWFINREMFGKLISFGLKLHINTISFIIFTQTDKLLIAYFLNIKYVAFYALATSLVSIMLQVPEIVTGALMPAFSELDAKKDTFILYKLLLRSTKYLFFLGIPLAVFLFYKAFELIFAWVGPGYREAAVILQILLLGYFFNMSVYSAVSLAQGIGRPDWQMWSGVILMCLNLPLCIVLFHLTGYTGIAWGTSLSVIFGVGYFYLRFFKYTGAGVFKSFRPLFYKPLIASVGALYIIWILTSWPVNLANVFIASTRLENIMILVVEGIVFLGIYLAILKFVRYFDSVDRQTFAGLPLVKVFVR